jgi:outer membrane protein OmpA-like peptidoglycan-associated protein
VVSDGSRTAATTVTLIVSPIAPTGIGAGVVGNPEARKALANPTFVNGTPVSRTLSNRVDSSVSWAVSPTTSVVAYRVFVNGHQFCTVPAKAGVTSHSCLLAGIALRPSDAVRVVAVGADYLVSAAAPVKVAPPGASRHLLAVVYFPVGKFSLDVAAQQVLARVAQQAKAYGFTTAVLVGHTDSDGSTASNLTLSRNRSGQVAGYMSQRFPGLVTAASGLGEAQPAMPNTNARNKSANRRVEVYVG